MIKYDVIQKLVFYVYLHVILFSTLSLQSYFCQLRLKAVENIETFRKNLLCPLDTKELK